MQIQNILLKKSFKNQFYVAQVTKYNSQNK